MSVPQSSFDKSDVEVLKKEVLFTGFFALNRYTIKHALFAGGTSAEIRREVFERGHAVGVLPYDPARDEVVLLEQFRFPAMETSASPWLVEVVAGIIEPGEDLEDVCHREAQEEAGVNLQKLTKINSYLASPGACTERIHLYIAKVDASEASGIHGLDSEAEDIRVFRLSLTDAKEWLRSGKIDNSTAIIALQWLLLNKTDLLASWQD
jgi:ADP-ribose pyrophosphatase